MTSNMGFTDRAVRVAVAAVLATVAVFVVSSPLSWVLGVVALVLIGTSLVGTCPAYLPFGFSTKERSPDLD